MCKIVSMETADVTIISYIPLSGLNFAVYTGQYCSYMPSSPLESIIMFDLVLHIL